MFYGRKANTIFVSIISLFIIPCGKLHRPYSGFILHYISNAGSAISPIPSVNPSKVLILLGTSRTKYFAHFSFRSARQAYKI